MRKILLITALVFTLFSCKKDGFDGSAFEGVWEFETSYNGSPANTINLPPGNGKIIVLSGFSEFERRAHDTLLYRGTYSLKKKKDCTSEEYSVNFSTSDPDFASDDHTYVELETNDRLRISSSRCLLGAGVTIYRRVQ